jgi:hypothetical protein
MPVEPIAPAGDRIRPVDSSTDALPVKIADTEAKFEAIHRLNHRTFAGHTHHGHHPDGVALHDRAGHPAQRTRPPQSTGSHPHGGASR